ncbi:unnamed protein product [Sphenostylis stenocarpa]|uniref:Uncharacterized protein n=1 Tax=Sphenostylis stenocarpa TaxID=92480 RepID=A0AA86W2I8_9FABA|nr:unnamed protein product [Sphenostylis stenocarpa]
MEGREKRGKDQGNRVCLCELYINFHNCLRGIPTHGGSRWKTHTNSVPVVPCE